MSSNIFISRRQASNVHHAIRIAELNGFELNHMLTINVSSYEGEIFALYRNLRCQFLNLFLRNELKIDSAVYVWVLERPNDAVLPHIHFLIHIPSHKKSRLEKALKDWISSKIGTVRNINSIKIEPIKSIVGAKRYILKRYILKGMDPVFAPMYNVFHKSQGDISGKRVGYTNNIGPAVKKRLSIDGQYHYMRSLWFST